METCSGDDSNDGTIWATVSVENELVGFDWQIELKSVSNKAFCSSSGVIVVWLNSPVVAVVKEGFGEFWWSLRTHDVDSFGSFIP